MSLNFPSPTQLANPYGMPQQQPPAAPVAPSVDPGASAMGQDSFGPQGAQDAQQMQALLQQLGGGPPQAQGVPGLPAGSQQAASGAQQPSPSGGGQMIQQGDMVLETGNNFGSGGGGLSNLYSKENLTSWKGLTAIATGLLIAATSPLWWKKVFGKAGEEAAKVITVEHHDAMLKTRQEVHDLMDGLADKLEKPTTEQEFDTLRDNLTQKLEPLRNLHQYIKDVADKNKFESAGKQLSEKLDALFKKDANNPTHEINKDVSKEPIQHITDFLNHAKTVLEGLKPAQPPSK